MSVYHVKEMFYTLQGEGAHSGRPAIFCRFAGCNLWSGREADRATAQCTFCDTDFVGTDGVGGGSFASPKDLVAAALALWPDRTLAPFVVCTGGEPLLQLDAPLIEAFHAEHFFIAIETNGTLPVPNGIDWVCMSPKGSTKVVVQQCNELKLVYPQPEAMPERFMHIQAQHYFLSPMNPPDGTIHTEHNSTQEAIAYCMANPRWKLNLQQHKLLGIA